MNRSIVPPDSALNYWLDGLSITEVPLSYQIVCGLAAIGTMLKRRVYVDQDRWRVFPNMSVLLIGPSGIGKDVVINNTVDVVESIGVVPTIAGRTMEYFKARLVELGSPAACCTPTPELTAFLGGKDYQKSMAQELTDLLSTGPKVDVSSKGDGERYVLAPTVTMLAGSTAAWLHKAMPQGSLDGGFLPRFVIVCERYGRKHVPWVKYSNDREDRIKAARGKQEFINAVQEIVISQRPGELVPTLDARDYYTNWYENRFKYFSPYVEAYANRSRDHLHRIAMLMGLSRGHSYLEEVDYIFGAHVINYVAKSIDDALAPTKA